MGAPTPRQCRVQRKAAGRWARNAQRFASAVRLCGPGSRGRSFSASLASTPTLLRRRPQYPGSSIGSLTARSTRGPIMAIGATMRFATTATGPTGMGSSFGPSLVDHLLDIETFRRIVHDGQSSGSGGHEGIFGETPTSRHTWTTSTPTSRRAPMASSAAVVRSGSASSEDNDRVGQRSKIGREAFPSRCGCVTVPRVRSVANAINHIRDGRQPHGK